MKNQGLLFQDCWQKFSYTRDFFSYSFPLVGKIRDDDVTPAFQGETVMTINGEKKRTCQDRSPSLYRNIYWGPIPIFLS